MQMGAERGLAMEELPRGMAWAIHWALP